MTLSRREFSIAGLGLAAGMAFSPLALARKQAGADSKGAEASAYYRWIELRPGVHAAVGVGDEVAAGGGNTLVIAGGDEAVLVDTKLCGIGQVLRHEAERFGSTITHVINTHHHADHLGGNPAFVNDAQLIAYEGLKPMVGASLRKMVQTARDFYRQAETENSSLPEPLAVAARKFWDGVADVGLKSFEPTRTVGKEAEMTLAGQPIRMRHAGAGHTNNDLFLYLPDLNLLHTGDLVFNGLHPYIDKSAGATTRGWEESCAAMLEMCDGETTVIPGHGGIGGPEIIRNQVEYFQTLRRMVKHAKNVEGMTREEVQKLTNSKIADLGFERLKEMNLGIMFDELEAEGTSKAD